MERHQRRWPENSTSFMIPFSMDFQECQSEQWTESILTHVDKLYLGLQPPTSFFLEDKLIIRAALLNYGLSSKNTKRPPNLFELWKTVHESWEETTSHAENSIKCTNNAEELRKTHRLPLDTPSSLAEIKRQIEVDILRSANYYDVHSNISESRRSDIRQTLSGILLDLCTSDSTTPLEEEQPTNGGDEWVPVEFRYLQGIHDIACVVLECGGESEHTIDEIKNLVKSIVGQRCFSFHSSLRISIAVDCIISQVSEILRVCSPDILFKLVQVSIVGINKLMGSGVILFLVAGLETDRSYTVFCRG